MRRGHWAAVWSAVAIAAVAAVASGCGGGKGLALDPVAAAATKTQSTGPVLVRFSLTLSGPRTHGRTVAVIGHGAIDGTSGELTVGLGSLLRQAGVPAGANASAKEVFVRHDGDAVLYFQSGLVARYLPAGKRWVELDLSKLGQAAGLDVGTLLAGAQIQPNDLLALLKAEGEHVANLGPATVDGVAVTHYRVTIDPAKALKANGLASPLLDPLAAKMPKLPVDVWISKDGLVRRVQASFSAQRHGVPVRAAMKVSLYDYGANVTIAAPPSSAAFDATQLAQLGIGSFH